MQQLNTRQKTQNQGRIQKDRTTKHIHGEKEYANKPHEAQVVSEAVPPVEKPETYHAAPKVGRNDPCPCGSGKKYKKCCLAKEK